MKNKTNYLILMVTILLVSACVSPQKVLEQGNYDRALRMSVDKLAGKKRKKLKYIQVLESAFNKANADDLHNIEVLKKENNAENWERIHNLYGEINYRQKLVSPLLPMASKRGYKPQLNFVDTDLATIESRKKSADFLYNSAVQLINEYEQTHDKFLARRAYDELMKLDKLYKVYKDKEALKVKAEQYGIDYYGFYVKNKSESIIPVDFENEIKSMGLNEINQTWKSVDLDPDGTRTYDYVAELVITNVIASPQSVKERQYDESKEIEDGFDYVLDANGNVMKDTSGNDIKLPRKIFIKGTVLEVHQYKDIRVEGYVNIMVVNTQTQLKSAPVNARFVFDNYASTFVGGDKRALSQETKHRLGNVPLPFPSDRDMLLDAAHQMKWDVKDILKSFKP